jgi:hypothetical protein
MPQVIQKAQFPQDIRDQLMRMIDYTDRISGVPAVYDARSEKSGESGYLFAQKTRAAEQQNFLPLASLKQHLNEKAEAYMAQAAIQYTIANVPRTFRLNNGKQSITINKKDTETGKLLNDFSMLPRHKVIVSESPTSTTNRMVARAVANETLRIIPPELVGTRAVLSGILAASMESFSPKDKERLNAFSELEEKHAKLQLENMNLKLEMENKQIVMQMNAPAPTPTPTAPTNVAAPQNGMEGLPVPAEKSLGYSNGGAF